MIGKPSIDKPWLKYYPESADKAPLPEKTVYEYLYERNKDYMNGIALEYYGTKISYAKFFEKVDETAKAFTAQGVKRGDIITVMLPNTPEAVYCFYALNKIGACANMLSPTFTPEHIAGSIDLTESRVIIMLDKFFVMFDKALEETSLEKVVLVSPFISMPAAVKLAATLKEKPMAIPQGEKTLDWKSFIKTGKNSDVPTAKYRKDTPAVIVYSSGSTGQSKGITLANEAFVGMVIQRDVEKAYMTRERGKLKCLTIIPMFFSTGINVCVNAMLCFNQTLVLDPMYNSDALVKGIKSNIVGFVFALPSHYEKLLNIDIGDISPLIIPIAGGEVLSSQLEDALNKYLSEHGSKARMMNGWGMCEYGSAVTHTLENDEIRKGTGKPLSHIIVSAFEPDTDEELSYNERGEIRVITPCRMLGYYKNPEATAEFFRKGLDGQVWGCSGDMGYIDEEGNVFIEGRATDYIRSANGNKVWLFDIENVLLADEAIQLCEAVGLEVGGGHIPVAHLVLKQGCGESPEDVIRRVHGSCVKALSEEAVPRGYKIRDSFNILPSGKRDTLSLKDERDGFVMPDDNGGLREINF